MADVVLSACGTLEAAGAICAVNGLPLSASVAKGTLAVGQNITIPDGVITDPATLTSLQGAVIGTDTYLVCGLVQYLRQAGLPTASTIPIAFALGLNGQMNGGTSAQVTISTTDAPGTPVNLITTGPTPNMTYTFTGLAGATTYYIYVRTVCDAGSCVPQYSAWARIALVTAP